MESAWIRRRWFDFRQGHSMYLIFAMAFANFILIFYRLLIERVEILGQIFSSLWIFVIVFVGIYIPVAGLIGYWHRKTQLRVEQDQSMRQNPLLARNFRMVIDMLENKATKEEIEDFRNLLKSIERGSGLGFHK
jgi:5-bromo-4-chloroindolyl phosphate hydrolysis protein